MPSIHNHQEPSPVRRRPPGRPHLFQHPKLTGVPAKQKAPVG
ncbi:hypothetical protein MBEBAB_1095 [Brevundimonas abyssalis TAR-001]|uniref:Uncharacterized protein n=1 Tax=Brevundimonas abyssalis TAR-001 TaxID=1391729 RepID=A0A8E0NBD0_9CAUL|nr:hypothetical protein MBEBAB_1095 [Brevundimonas abyssalis TAR-001]